jgi:hypothetical protein
VQGNTAEIITAAKDIILACAAIVTATVAVKGLRRWREELRGKVEFEVSRNLARATYKLRDEIQRARSPLIRGSEFPSSYGESEKSGSSSVEADAWAHIYQNRFGPVLEALRDFDAQALEAEALWGSDIRKSAADLRHCAHRLSVSMQAIVDDKAQNGENFRANRDFGVKVRADVAALPSQQDNPLSQQIETAVLALEGKLKTHLSRD